MQISITKQSPIKKWLIIFLLLVTYDGAIRKWGFPASEQIIFLIKDLVIAFMFLAVLFTIGFKNTILNSSVGILFLIFYVAYSTMEIVNPNLPTIALAIWGLKSHILFISLLFILPAIFKNTSDLYIFIEQIYPWITIPVCILAIIQSIAGADSPINGYVQGDIDSFGVNSDGDALGYLNRGINY